MNKSLIIFFCIAAFAFVATGCDNSTPTVTGNTASEETPSVHLEDVDEKSPEPTPADIQYSAMIPDPEVIFKNGEINITDPDGGTAYIFEASNITMDEVNTYIAECKKLGFDDVSYEVDTSFGAYSTDGAYWVSVDYNGDKNIVYILCQTSRDNLD